MRRLAEVEGVGVKSNTYIDILLFQFQTTV